MKKPSEPVRQKAPERKHRRQEDKWGAVAGVSAAVVVTLVFLFVFLRTNNYSVLSIFREKHDDGASADFSDSEDKIPPSNQKRTAVEEQAAVSDDTTTTQQIQLPPEDKTIDLPDGVKLEMVKVEAGWFEMSANDGRNDPDEVAHLTILTKDFYIGKTEVTQAQWKAVMGTNPSGFKGDDLPVEKVSWYNAMEFCEKLNSTGMAPAGWRFTLPTETQWEYAARGGRKSKGHMYSGSNKVDDVAWYHDNSDSKTHPVGQKTPNALGLHDMSGNVFEWCLDDWKDKSDMLTAEFSRSNDQSDSKRGYRGGGWGGYDNCCRSAYRGRGNPGIRNNALGFRVALVPESY